MKAELRRAWPLSGLLQMNWSNVVQEAALFSQSGPRAARGKKKQPKKTPQKTLALRNEAQRHRSRCGRRVASNNCSWRGQIPRSLVCVCVCQTGLFPNSANPPPTLSKYDPYAPAVVRGQLCYSRPGTGRRARAAGLPFGSNLIKPLQRRQGCTSG